MISNWREELREVVDEIEPKAEKKVKEGKGIKNKVVINPKLDEAVKEIGGELLEVKEVDVDQKIKDREKEKEDEKKNKEANAIKSLTPTGAQEDPSLKQKEKQANNMKKRVLLQKLRAVRSGAGDSIMASHEPEGEVIAEKDLNAAERRALPNKDFVFPGKGEGPEGKQRGAYPINDKKRARAALSMAAAHASPEKEAKVKAAVKKKFPDIQQESALTMIGRKKKEKKAEKAMDAGAKARRAMKRREHAKYVSGSTENVPDDMREEKSAFDFVKKQIAAKYGKSGYVSKDNPRKPQTDAEKAKVRAHQAKVDKENAAARAKDPSQGRYPKG